MKRFLLILVLGFAWVLPAHAALFYEFNPDYSQSLLVASSDTVSELFLPLNDYLGALDFWASNANSAGEVTFTLYNSSGSQLAEQTLMVPAIPDTAGGTRLHISLPAQIAVTGTSAYRVRITTVVPTFRLYYADATQLLAHNGAPVPAYTGGLARIGTTDMGFSFKFSLYESLEHTPPQLTNIVVTQVSSTEAIITYTSNEPVDRRLTYGSAVLDWNSEYSSCAPTIQSCSISLPVAPATTYAYTLAVRDVWGNQAAATGTFTSLSNGETPTPTPSASLSPSTTPTLTPTPSSTPDVTAPVLSNARLVSSTPHTASFAWTTNEAANSVVVVQILPYLIAAGTNTDSTLELEHLVNVGNLPSDTLLRATITSSDASGNSKSVTLDFMTPVEAPLTTSPPVTPPLPSTTPFVSGPQDNPKVTWTQPANTNASTSYRIDVFDSSNTLIRTITVPARQYQAALGALPKGDNRVVIYSKTDGVFEKVAPPMPVSSGARSSSKSFLERAVIALPYILGGGVLILFVIVGVMRLRKPKTTASRQPVSSPISPTSPPSIEPQ